MRSFLCRVRGKSVEISFSFSAARVERVVIEKILIFSRPLGVQMSKPILCIASIELCELNAGLGLTTSTQRLHAAPKYSASCQLGLRGISILLTAASKYGDFNCP